MRNLIGVLVRIYRRWRFVEELVEPTERVPQRVERTPERELQSLREAVARQEHKVEEYRRMHCDSLARDCEASVRALRLRIRALEMDLRRAV